MKKIFLLLLLLLLIPKIAYSAAATMYCTVNGAGNKDGTNWANAFGYGEWETDVEGSAEAGDVYYVQEGTYTLTSDLTTALDGTSTSYITIIGVKSGTTAEPPTFSDWAFTTDRPLIDDGASDYQFLVDDYWKVHNIRATLSGTVGIGAGRGCLIENCKITNSTGKGFYFDTAHVQLIKCEGITTNSSAIDSERAIKIIGCYFHDSTTGIDLSGSNSRGIIAFSVADTCTTGIFLDSANTFHLINNTIYNCTTGINAAANVYFCIFINNIIDACADGAVWNEAQVSNFWDNNCWDNTSDVTNVTQGNNKVEGDPGMTDPANGDFTLGSGSNCINTGLKLTTNEGVGVNCKVNIGVDQDDVAGAGGGAFGWWGKQ